VSADLFELSIGRYLKSAYTFRVGHSAGACRASATQRGRTFDE
jgi:hypothetical protein